MRQTKRRQTPPDYNRSVPSQSPRTFALAPDSDLFHLLGRGLVPRGPGGLLFDMLRQGPIHIFIICLDCNRVYGPSRSGRARINALHLGPELGRGCINTFFQLHVLRRRLRLFLAAEPRDCQPSTIAAGLANDALLSSNSSAKAQNTLSSYINQRKFAL